MQLVFSLFPIHLFPFCSILFFMLIVFPCKLWKYFHITWNVKDLEFCMIIRLCQMDFDISTHLFKCLYLWWLISSCVTFPLGKCVERVENLVLMRKSVTQEVSNFQDKQEEDVHVVTIHIPIESLKKKMVKAKQGEEDRNEYNPKTKIGTMWRPRFSLQGHICGICPKWQNLR